VCVCVCACVRACVRARARASNVDCICAVCVVARSTYYTKRQRRKSQFVVAGGTPTSQSGTKASPPTGAKSSDHVIASSGARTTGKYQRSGGESVRSVLTVYQNQIAALQVAVLDE